MISITIWIFDSSAYNPIFMLLRIKLQLLFCFVYSNKQHFFIISENVASA